MSIVMNVDYHEFWWIVMIVTWCKCVYWVVVVGGFFMSLRL